MCYLTVAAFLQWQIVLHMWDRVCWGEYIYLPITPGQNGHRFADDISRFIFVNEKFCLFIEISRKYVHKGPIDKNLALFQIMAWRRIGVRSLSEPMLTRFTGAYMQH